MNKQIKKRITILSIVTIVAASSLHAQPGQRPPQPPVPDLGQIVQMVDELTTTLSLSDEQALKILNLYTDHFTELKTNMENDKSQREDQRKTMENHRKNFEEEVKATLTDEQKEQFETFLKENKPQRGPGPRGPRK